MKTLIFILLILNFVTPICTAQLTNDYPFKTYLDKNNKLYVVGNKLNQSNGTYDILIEKYIGSTIIYSQVFANPAGDDRGLDLVVDSLGNILITGFVYKILIPIMAPLGGFLFDLGSSAAPFILAVILTLVAIIILYMVKINTPPTTIVSTQQ